jgi:hypothetical protein
MALQDNLQTNFGFTQNNAYFKIVGFTGNKDVINFQLSAYASEEAKNANAMPLQDRTFHIANPGSVTLGMLYDYLKTLPEYAGAVDI